MKKTPVKIITLYRTVLFFETDDEEATERTLGVRVVVSRPDLADWSFKPRSQTLSPHVTIQGPSRPRVKRLAELVRDKLTQVGVEFVEQEM